MMEAFEKDISTWRIYFDELRPSIISDDPIDRFAWVEITDLPIICWNASAITKVLSSYDFPVFEAIEDNIRTFSPMLDEEDDETESTSDSYENIDAADTDSNKDGVPQAVGLERDVDGMRVHQAQNAGLFASFKDRWDLNSVSVSAPPEVLFPEAFQLPLSLQGQSMSHPMVLDRTQEAHGKARHFNWKSAAE
ncbi:hypothetical protein NC653_014655 [Populus alba x Populus x berolinensis]|uniref:Uncharacterized protein n=1 Tax=Populus alba x Populus x berolinensis TaxID=444605 RepID=A0AAD6W4P5_9ROSI|nr:hypothetical protein NC653_014655 [Populus alba x Populus x berolinensis]